MTPPRLPQPKPHPNRYYKSPHSPAVRARMYLTQINNNNLINIISIISTVGNGFG